MTQTKEIDVEDVRSTIALTLCIYIEKRNTLGYTADEISPNMKLLDIFPSEPVEKGNRWHYVDEQANRLGMAIFDTVRFLRHKLGIPDLSHNFEPREEFFIFDVVDDVVLHLLTEVLQHLTGIRGDE